MAQSIVEQIMELEAKKQELMAKAKTEALAAAQKAVADLNDLGFHYTLVEGGTTVTRTTNPTTRTRAPRAGGISEQVLETIASAPDGLIRADILEKMNAFGNNTMINSISNAMSNLQKKGKVTRENGIWKAV